MIRRCYECRRWYLPYWHGNADIRIRDGHGKELGKRIHGHPTCLMSVFRRECGPKPPESERSCTS